MKKEIEIKIKLESKQIEILQKWLSKNAKDFGKIVIDDYYLKFSDRPFYVRSKNGFKDPLEIVRVRKTKDKSFVCYKKRTIDDDGYTVYVEELDLGVPADVDFLNFFKKLGFTEEVVIKKNRHIYLCDNKFEVVFDSIENFGEFVEVEIKNFDGTVEDGMNEIYGFLKEIEIKEFISYDRGYLCMILNPEYDFGKKVTLK